MEALLTDKSGELRHKQEQMFHNFSRIVKGYKWVEMCAGDPVPDNAVLGGEDSHGSPIYIGVGYHRGDILPVHINPRKRSAFVSWGGKQISVSSYRVRYQLYRCKYDVE